MPQLDKVTFFPILFWLSILYIGGFLFLNSTALYLFLSTLRLSCKRGVQKFLSGLVIHRFVNTALLFPWIAL